MKTKLILLMLLCMTAKAACAQEASVQTQEPVKEKKFTITPRAGFAASRFKGHLFHQPTGTPWVASAVVGVEAEYVLNKMLGLSLGGFWMQEGGRLGDIRSGRAENSVLMGGTSKMGWNYILRRKFRKNVMSFPVRLVVHTPLKGLSISGGLGLDWVMKTTFTYQLNRGMPVSLAASPDQQPIMELRATSMKDEGFKKFTTYGEAGISYAYKDVVLDVRYHLGLSRCEDQDYFSNTPNPSAYSGLFVMGVDPERKIKQHAVMLTLGYQFHL